MIKAVDIVVGYQGTTGTPVAGPLSFSFADGECVMLRGRNGSGKTTLMKTLAGLLPPLSGSFETGGEALRQAQVGAILVPTRIPKVRGAFYECWRQISGELNSYPVDMVAYELMNEPVADDPEDWNRIVGECYSAVRALEKKRVIVIGSNMWQSFDTVSQLALPEGDPNIILSFHYYNPMLLTHYQASWMDLRDYHGPVHYPGQVVTEEELSPLTERDQELGKQGIGQTYGKDVSS